MATKNEAKAALQKAAEELSQRPVNSADLDRLVEEFERMPGRPIEKAIGSLSKITGQTQRQISEKAASSDNTDRLIQDLAKTIENIKK